MSEGRWHEVQHDLREPAKELRSLIPEVLQGYSALHRAAVAEGELPQRTKELIALAVAVALKCDGCIASHARALARLRALQCSMDRSYAFSHQARSCLYSKYWNFHNSLP
jgi:AhpD family alkylhydroperoxidase